MQMLFVCLATLAVGADAYSLRSGSSGKLSIIEERMTRQMKLAAPERATLNNMEAQLISLAQKKMKGDTGSDLEVFLADILELVQDTMVPNILGRKNTTQAELDAAYQSLASCTHPNVSYEASDIDQLAADHRTCRIAEDAEWTEYDQNCLQGAEVLSSTKAALCGAYDEAKAAALNKDRCEMADGTPVPTIGNYLIEMEGKFVALLDDLLDKKWKCGNATSPGEEDTCDVLTCDYYVKKLECDRKQGDFEDEACELFKNNTCSKYNTCYDNAKKTYDDAERLAGESEEGYKAEWRSVKRIECYAIALNGTSTTLKAELDTCKTTTVSTKPVELRYYYVVPVKETCTEQGNMEPGTALFGTTWYDGLPTHGAAATCASSCCMEEPYNPTLPDNHSDCFTILGTTDEYRVGR